MYPSPANPVFDKRCSCKIPALMSGRGCPVHDVPPPPQQSRAPLTFRNSKIVYYGPHACSNCGATICKMGSEFGGNAFTYPEGPIYPNTEWHAHVCDPKMVAKHRELSGSAS